MEICLFDATWFRENCFCVELIFRESLRMRASVKPCLGAPSKHCSLRLLAHFLIPRIEDQVGIFAVELPTGKAPEFLAELLVESTYRARAKTVPPRAPR
jgi:hypothetical protein